MKLRLLKQIYHIPEAYSPNNTLENDLILQSFNDKTNQWENVPVVIQHEDDEYDFIDKHTGKTKRDVTKFYFKSDKGEAT